MLRKAIGNRWIPTIIPGATKVESMIEKANRKLRNIDSSMGTEELWKRVNQVKDRVP